MLMSSAAVAVLPWPVCARADKASQRMPLPPLNGEPRLPRREKPRSSSRHAIPCSDNSAPDVAVKRCIKQFCSLEVL